MSEAVPRRIRDEADARACLEAARAAGLTPHAWARSNGVAPRSMSWWRERVALIDGQVRRERSRVTRTCPPPSPRLVEVALPVRPPASARYEVMVGRCRVVVEDDFAEATLARLLRVVASC